MGHTTSLKASLGLVFVEGDFCRVIFRHSRTQRAARVFLEWLKKRGGEADRRDISLFAYSLQDGNAASFTYRRENFYRLVLRRLMDLGFMELAPRYDPSSKLSVTYRYAAVYQPIPKKPPPGDSNWWKLAWAIADKWNREFFTTTAKQGKQALATP